MAIKAVLFDLDGTLLNTLSDLADAGNRTLSEMQLPTYPENAYRRFVGDGVRMLCIRMLPEQLRDDIHVAQARALFDVSYQAHMFDRTAPYDGIPALLSGLRKKGLKLGIVSNKPDGFVQSIAERYFPGSFDAVAGQQGVLVKPDPTGVNLVLRRFGVSPEEALYVGDSSVDIQTAKNAGTHSCGVTWGFRGERELRENGAEYLAFTPTDVEDVLSRIN